MSSEAIRRRAFLLFSGGAAALLLWPHRLSAQQPPAKVYRIFWASTESQPDPFVDGFREGLRERGYVEGKNFILELRYAPGNPDALRAVLSELTRSKVDLAVSSGPAIRAMKRATDVPVLFAISGDPVELGLVKSLNRPGGTFTGSTFLSLDKESRCSRRCFRACGGSLCCRTPIILASAWNGTPLNRRRKS